MQIIIGRKREMLIIIIIIMIANTGLEKIGYSSNHLNPVNMNGSHYELCAITASNLHR